MPDIQVSLFGAESPERDSFQTEARSYRVLPEDRVMGQKNANGGYAYLDLHNEADAAPVEIRHMLYDMAEYPDAAELFLRMIDGTGTKKEEKIPDICEKMKNVLGRSINKKRILIQLLRRFMALHRYDVGDFQESIQ